MEWLELTLGNKPPSLGTQFYCSKSVFLPTGRSAPGAWHAGRTAKMPEGLNRRSRGGDGRRDHEGLGAIVRALAVPGDDMKRQEDWNTGINALTNALRLRF